MPDRSQLGKVLAVIDAKIAMLQAARQIVIEAQATKPAKRPRPPRAVKETAA